MSINEYSWLIDNPFNIVVLYGFSQKKINKSELYFI